MIKKKTNSMATTDQYKYWLLEMLDGVLWLKINRPAKKNSFNPDVLEELASILYDAAHNQDIRILVLTSAMEEIFSAGADIEWFYTLNGPQGEEVSIRVQEVFSRLENLPFPVIAGVKGLNLTAGFELMLACDLVIAADNAKFGQIETKWGLTPGGGGTQRLTQRVGAMKAREIIYTAKIFGAEEALSIGLINKVVPLADIEKEIKDLAKKIMKNSARAIKESKFLIQKATFMSLHGYRQENKVFGDNFASGEPRERFQSFLDKMKK